VWVRNETSKKFFQSTSLSFYEINFFRSCYSFAAGAVLSSHYKLHLGMNIIPSREDLIDCNPQGNGCNGGDQQAMVASFATTKTVCSYKYPYLYSYNPSSPDPNV